MNYSSSSSLFYTAWLLFVWGKFPFALAYERWFLISSTSFSKFYSSICWEISECLFNYFCYDCLSGFWELEFFSFLIFLVLIAWWFCSSPFWIGFAFKHRYIRFFIFNSFITRLTLLAVYLVVLEFTLLILIKQ